MYQRRNHGISFTLSDHALEAEERVGTSRYVKWALSLRKRKNHVGPRGRGDSTRSQMSKIDRDINGELERRNARCKPSFVWMEPFGFVRNKAISTNQSRLLGEMQ